MVDYSVKLYSKDLNWAITKVLDAIDGADRYYPYCDPSQMVVALADLKSLIDSIVTFPGLDVIWSEYHEHLDRLIMFDSRISLDKRLLQWYILDYRTQRTLKFKCDLMNYYEILHSVVNSFVEWSKKGTL